ncbi:MAG: GntR family transcriptional regulator [Hydrogenoanaerobacterium sp.]
MDVSHIANLNLLHKQVENSIKSKIINGKWKTGEKISSEAELSAQYGVSRVTVRTAVANLVKEGILVRLQGKGTFVVSTIQENTMRSIYSFTTLCQIQGRTASAKLICAGLEKAEQEEQEFLSIPSDEKAFVLSRLRQVDQVPLLIETCIFHGRFSFLANENLEGSLYSLLAEKYHIVASKAVRTISICNANEEQAAQLNVSVGAALILNKCNVYDNNNLPLHVANQIVRVDLPDIFKYYV